MKIEYNKKELIIRLNHKEAFAIAIVLECRKPFKSKKFINDTRINLMNLLFENRKNALNE